MITNCFVCQSAVALKYVKKKIHNEECDPFCTSNILTDYLLHHHSQHLLLYQLLYQMLLLRLVAQVH